MNPARALGLQARGAVVAEVDTRRRVLIANASFWAFLALVLIGVSPFREWQMTAQTGQGDFTNQALYIAIFVALLLGSGGVVMWRELVPLPLSMLALLGYCLMSVTWAIDPVISVRRLVLTALVIWVVFRCVNDLGYARALFILRCALIALLVINFATVFLTPYGVHGTLTGEITVVGDWRGIMPHKNIAGAVCVFTIILEMFDRRRVPLPLSFAAIAGSLIFLYFTQSKTSETVLLFAVVGGWIVRPYNASYRTALGVTLLVAGGVAAQIASIYSTTLENFVNDPTSLTGRGAIWPLLLRYAGDHPWTGAGFGSFWQIGDASPIWQLTNGWVARFGSHGHNGYLDLLVTIGAPGLVLAVLALLVWPLMRLFLSLSVSKPRRALLFALLTACAGLNLTESSILNGPSVVEVFLILTIALIHGLSDRSAGHHQAMRRHMLRRGGMVANAVRRG